MFRDSRKLSLLAVVLIVLLRISIGWHIFYEGLWKFNTLKTPNPWSASGYLKNATGPLRPYFRQMVDDPDDLKWLDFDNVMNKWHGYQERFLEHYVPLATDDDPVKKGMARLIDGAGNYSVPLADFPKTLDLADIDGVNKKAVSYDGEKQRLVADGKLHLLPIERDRLIDKVNMMKTESKISVEELDAIVKAVNDLYKVSSKLSFSERLAALLKGDPERVGVTLQPKSDSGAKEDSSQEGTGDGAVVVQVGEIDLYKEQVKRYEESYAKAKTKFEWDHVEKQGKELAELRQKLVGPIKALDQELKSSAEELLSTEQLAAGPIPITFKQDQLLSQFQENWVDWTTIGGLALFGLLLMVGFFTRFSAFCGALLLTMFYLAMPPWPGVQEIPGIEHNLIVNKVLVEAIALFVIATLNSGRWF
ncbi:MAG: DoxX family protein, partial [Planctomycetes bacterium]|nr:DoxX family protein [Planctomycetota bacterium]